MTSGIFISVKSFNATSQFLIVQSISPIYLGDSDYKPYVSADPDVTTIEMNGSEDFMIIGCDGLWDHVSLEEATDIVFAALKEDKGTSSRFEIPSSHQELPTRIFLRGSITLRYGEMIP